MRRSVCLSAAVAAVLASSIYGDDIKGAAEILRDANAAAAAAKPTAEAVQGRQKLADDVKAAARTIADQPAEEAAARWLALSDRQRDGLHANDANAAAPFVARRYEQPLSFQELMAALPTAPQLDALKAELDKRPLNDAGGQRVALLKMLVARLRGSDADLDAAFNDLRTAAVARNTPAARIDARFAQFRTELEGKAEDDDPMAQLERELKPIDGNAFGNASQSRSEIDVPDLVTLVGEEKAREYLERLLKMKSELRIFLGDATKKLAREIALKQVESMRLPQWLLCDSVDAVELYEAMVKKFPDAEDDDGPDYGRSEARQYYLVGLIIRGRTDDAVKVANEMAAVSPDADASTVASAAEGISNAGFSDQLHAFLKRVVSADGASPLWGLYVTTAARTGHADEALALAREIAARPGLTADSQAATKRRLADALLAADQIDEGAALLKSIDGTTEVRSAVRLATIGRLAKKDDIAKPALDDATRLLKRNDLGYMGESLRPQWAREMQLAGRDGELAISLGQQLAAINSARESSYSVPEPLVELADVYYRANRPVDVMAMLDSFPQWPAKDVADLPVGGGAHDSSKPVAFYAAWALLKTGHAESGAAALDYVLDRRGGLDAAYQLLIETNPDGAMAKLDQLAANDAFEERPLIWKAALLRKAGKLDEAEKCLRDAIKIDPSDGEEGKNDRMRVYANLADVLADKGDAKQAEFFRGVVTSIRLSEDADDAWQAGLLTRAIKMYEEALTHFSDAYCIQSRLAVQLSQLGREKEAEEHYQRAYELMPDSFGRVESHCFGCEGAFRSDVAQGIAERTFNRLLAANPDKPQLHYLLGYLRQSQGRYGEALPEFRKAVALDPKYLNAWKELLDCKGHVAMPAAESDRAAITILTLDPQGRHSGNRTSDVRDVAALYRAASENLRVLPIDPSALYPLRAAAARKSAAESDPNHFVYHSSFSTDAKTPGALVAQNERVRPIVGWMDEFGQ